MNNKYISTDNFEVIENPNFFEVDEGIAEAVSILNKKGYRTLYSCAGHNYKTCYKATASIDMLEESKKIFNIYIGKINKDTFDYYSDAQRTNTYIKFARHYDFPFLPDGFKYETAQEAETKFKKYEIQNDSKIIFGDTVSKTILLFQNNIRLDDNYIENEIKEANRVLLDWATKLPIIQK